MFELSVAFKYLTPRWRHLSVSIISLISILVIALVVWLIVVFFSVTNGLEKSWVGKLTTLTAPLRITPNESYYHSYYYLVDGLSQSSGYATKTIEEKLNAEKSDPYDKEIDEEIPFSWSKPDLDTNGELKDPIKLAFKAIENLKGTIADIQASDFEMTLSNLHLQLIRKTTGSPLPPLGLQFEQSTLKQSATLGSFDPQNLGLNNALLKPTQNDLTNSYQMLGIDGDFRKDDEEFINLAQKKIVQKRLQNYFEKVQIQELETPLSPWILPKSLYPKSGQFKALALKNQNGIDRLIIPQNKNDLKKKQGQSVTLEFRDHTPWIIQEGKAAEIASGIPLSLENGVKIPVKYVENSLEKANRPQDVLFQMSFRLQGTIFEGKAPIGSLLIQRVAKTGDSFPLTAEETIGEGVLLPRNFRDGGILAGDRGYLSYMAPTTSTIQEQRVPIFVAGFYDPGVIPMGGKYIMANKEVVSLIHSSQGQEGSSLSNGINVRFADLEQADLAKQKLQQAFIEEGISPYFHIETFREFEFTKDILQQLKSEKHLFTLLATIIILVACSNIISMLIILVNDKKTEIGILRSMGATSSSIALIFGICGVVMGFLGSFLGILCAIITLKNLQPLINLLSLLQGHDMFNPLFFGETLPTDLSFEALLFVVIATGFISLVAGLVPALKASLLRPSAILRSE